LLDDLRKPIFIVALVFIALAVLVELGSIGLVSQSAPSANSLNAPTPGRGIPTLALLDALVLYATIIMGLALIIPERIQGRVQGIVTLVVAIVLLLAAIPVVFGEISLLILMISLLFAPPFGTIAYFVAFASFNTDGARIALSIIMVLKLLFAVCLVLSQQRFLQNKGLMLIIITSFVATLVLGFLQGMVPGFLVSITDDIGGIIICVLAIIWDLVYLLGGILSVAKAVV
jgi:ABC-type transport system involved in cytochrome c biogenesis permease subunit